MAPQLRFIILGALLCLVSADLFGQGDAAVQSFESMMDKLREHSSIKAKRALAGSEARFADYLGSWRDPQVTLDAQNFPLHDLDFGRTPMSSLGVSVSQQIPLTGRLGLIQAAGVERHQAGMTDASISVRALQKMVWLVLIDLHLAGREQSILNENLSWFEQMIRVSTKRYTSGQSTQEAVMALKVSQKTLEGEVKRLTFEISRLWQMLALVLDTPGAIPDLDRSTIPWDWLWDNWKQVDRDGVRPEEEKIEAEIRAFDLEVRAAERERIPDLTLGAAYRYRERAGVDPGYDFVTGKVGFSIPLLQHYGAKIEALSAKRKAAMYRLKQSQNEKLGELGVVEQEVNAWVAEHQNLRTNVIPLAEVQRDISAKNYRVGVTRYTALIQNQVNLQDLMLKEARLKAKIQKLKVHFRYVAGAALVEPQKAMNETRSQ